MSYYEYQLNLKNLFVNVPRNFPNREIVYKNKERYTYKRFFERVAGLAAGLDQIGVKQGDVVAVIDWDTNRYLEAYFAVPMMGAILHTVNIRYPPEIIYYTMRHANDKYVIVRDEFLPLIEKNASLFDFVKGWIVYNEDRKTVSTSLKPYYDYEDIVQGKTFEFPDLNERTTATIFYTSGTTGMPKGVTFTHRDLVLHTLVNSLVTRYPPLEVTEKDNFLILVPMFHVHQWGMPYSAILGGNKYILPGRYEVGMILELIKRERVTFSAMVPSILYMILNAPNIDEYKDYLKGWKVTIGGAALPKGLALKAKSLGITTISGYGLSETAPVLTIAYFNDFVRDLKEEEKIEYMISTGIPLPMVQLRVVDPNNNDVPWDGRTVGEIIVRAPWNTKGYYLDEEKTKQLWKDGWLHTGDLAVIDQYGYIRIVDREKDAIKSGGEFIPSLILENVISEHPLVGEVAVVGMPHEKWGERPVAFIVRKGNVDEKSIIDHLNKYVEKGTIQKWWIPDKIIFVDSLPKTSTGKIDKKELRKNF